MSIQPMHVLERTSKTGGPFVGRCILCGKSGLSMGQANETCANPRNVSLGSALSMAITGNAPQIAFRGKRK